MYFNQSKAAGRGSLLRNYSTRLQLYVERRYKPVTSESRGREIAFKNAVALAAFGAKRDLMQSLVDVLRTSLVSILECGELIERQDRGELVAEYADAAKYVADASATLMETVSSVLEMAQVEIGRYDAVDEEFDVSKAIVSTMLIFESYARAANVSLRSITPPNLPNIFADLRAFKLALATLICRGIQAANAIGAQVIVLTRHSANGKLAISVACASTSGSSSEGGESEAEKASVGTSKSENHADQLLVENLVGMSGGSIHMQSDGVLNTVVAIVFPAERLRTAKEGADHAPTEPAEGSATAGAVPIAAGGTKTVALAPKISKNLN